MTAKPTPDFPEPLFGEIMEGKMEIIEQLERFIFHEYIRESPENIIPANTTYPKLQWFINDVHYLLVHLQSRFDNSKSADPLSAFDKEVIPLWKERWKGVRGWVYTKSQWREYRNGLCDCLFGLWKEKGPRDSDELPMIAFPELSKVEQMLRSVPFSRRPGGLEQIPNIKYQKLDAASIQRHGPYRFRLTRVLDDHLRITGDKTILIYTDFRTLGGLRHHKVLLCNRKGITVFDALVTRTSRYADLQNAQNVRDAVRHLHHYVPISIMLLFFQDITSGSKRAKIRAYLPQIPFITGDSSIRIARNALHLDVSRATQEKLRERSHCYLDKIDGWEGMIREDAAFRWNFAFKERFDDLVRELQQWEPETIWETMRYTGYGGRAIEVYGVYFTFIFGLITFLALVVSIVQAVTGFKQLQGGKPAPTST